MLSDCGYEYDGELIVNDQCWILRLDKGASADPFCSFCNLFTEIGRAFHCTFLHQFLRFLTKNNMHVNHNQSIFSSRLSIQPTQGLQHSLLFSQEHPLDLKPCPYCDKRFYNKSNLNQHINTHKEPRFNCEEPVRLAGMMARSAGLPSVGVKGG